MRGLLGVHSKMDLRAFEEQRLIIVNAKIEQTARERPIYEAFHERRTPNTMYGIETDTRQALLRLLTPYFTKIVQFLATPSQFEQIQSRYPRWIENIFTRNTVASNLEYMEYMTLSHAWSENNWNNLQFNYFCEKLHGDLGRLLYANGVTIKDIQEFKTIVRVVSQQGGWLVYDAVSHRWVSQIDAMGWQFAYTQDDDGPTYMFPDAFPSEMRFRYDGLR